MFFTIFYNVESSIGISFLFIRSLYKPGKLFCVCIRLTLKKYCKCGNYAFDKLLIVIRLTDL